MGNGFLGKPLARTSSDRQEEGGSDAQTAACSAFIATVIGGLNPAVD